MRSGNVNDAVAAISDTLGRFILSNIAVVRLAIMIRIHEVSRSTLGPFPRRHHVTIRCYMAYPDDEVFQALQRQVAKNRPLVSSCLFVLYTDYSRVSLRIPLDGLPPNFKLEIIIKISRKKKIQILVKIG